MREIIGAMFKTDAHIQNNMRGLVMHIWYSEFMGAAEWENSYTNQIASSEYRMPNMNQQYAGYLRDNHLVNLKCMV